MSKGDKMSWWQAAEARHRWACGRLGIDLLETGSVFDKYGVKPLVITGSVGYLVSIFALSFCTGDFGPFPCEPNPPTYRRPDADPLPPQ